MALICKHTGSTGHPRATATNHTAEGSFTPIVINVTVPASKTAITVVHW